MKTKTELTEKDFELLERMKVTVVDKAALKRLILNLLPKPNKQA